MSLFSGGGSLSLSGRCYMSLSGGVLDPLFSPGFNLEFVCCSLPIGKG